jgi:hypothetical protein
MIGLITLWALLGALSLAATVFFIVPVDGERDEGVWIGTLFAFPLAVFFGLGAALWTRAVRRRSRALSVDPAGITLGRFPFPPSREVHVPWRDVATVVTYYWPKVHADVIGLRLRDGATRPPGVPGPGSLRARLRQRPGEVDRIVRGWRLDRFALLEALAAYAPDVDLDDPMFSQFLSEHAGEEEQAQEAEAATVPEHRRA